MTTREELIAPYLDEVLKLDGVISERDYARRYDTLVAVHPSFLPMLGPLLADKNFNPGVYLLIMKNIFGTKSMSELGITSIDRETFKRVGEMEWEFTKNENNDLFPNLAQDMLGKAYDTLRLAAFVATADEVSAMITNLHAIASLMMARNVDHHGIIAMLPTISKAPALTSGAL